jgi:large repetitive protein
MRRFVTAFFAAAMLAQIAAPALAASGWQETSTMNWTRYAMSAARVGHKIYLIGDPYKLHIYDISNNTWSDGKVIPNNQFGPIVALGTKLYVIGGTSGPKTTGDVSIYDTTTGNWSAGPALPSPRQFGGAAVLNGKIYLVGGRGYQGATLVDLSDLEVLDPTTNAWHSAAAMPTARGSLAFVADPTGGMIYAIGGWNSNKMNPSGKNEAYNPATNTWQELSRLPTPRMLAGAGLLNGKIYILGGSTNRVMYSAVEAFDIAAGTWSARMALPTVRPNASAVTYEGTLFVTAGNVCQGSACYGTNRFWVSTTP